MRGQLGVGRARGEVRASQRGLNTPGALPGRKSALKLIYLALRHAEKKWTMPIRNWKLALNQLAIKFEGRLPL